MLFSQIIPPLLPQLCPKSVLYVCVSFAAQKEDHQCCLSRFYIYVLIYNICLSELLHLV